MIIRKIVIALVFILLLNPISFSGVTFDLADDSVDLGSSNDNLSKITISAWVYPVSEGEGGVGTIYIKDAAGTTRHDFRFDNTNNLFFRIGRATSPESKTTDNNVLPNGAWAHVAVVWDGTLGDYLNDIKIYVNGTEAGTNTGNNGSGARTDDNTATEHIGNRAGDTQTWDGQITEFAIWEDDLNATEISLLASSKVKGIPLQIRPSTLKVYLPMNEVSDGASADGVSFINQKNPGTSNGTGDNGANNTGLTGAAEGVLSYP